MPEIRHDMPKGVRRAVRWKRRSYLLISLAAGTTGAMTISAIRDPFFYAAPLISLIVLGGAAWYCSCKAKKARLQYRLRGGRFCSKCYQNLRGLDDYGTCPECGAYFDTDADRWE